MQHRFIARNDARAARQAVYTSRTSNTRLVGGANQLAKNNLKGYNSIMQKGVPHGKLAIVQVLVAVGKIRTTYAARQGALDFKEPLK